MSHTPTPTAMFPRLSPIPVPHPAAADPFTSQFVVFFSESKTVYVGERVDLHCNHSVTSRLLTGITWKCSVNGVLSTCLTYSNSEGKKGILDIKNGNLKDRVQFEVKKLTILSTLLSDENRYICDVDENYTTVERWITNLTVNGKSIQNPGSFLDIS